MTDEALAVEIVRMVQGSANPMMRTEAYCQLIKQLRNNPNAQSVSLVVSDWWNDQKGWDLMAVFINWFLPEDAFVNYLIVFLWENAPDSDKLSLLIPMTRRFVKLLNNSYYSNKYRRDSTFLNGLRSPPSQPSHIRDFLVEFTANTRRFSIESAFVPKATQPSAEGRRPSVERRPTINTSAPARTSVGHTMQGSPRLSGYNTSRLSAYSGIQGSPRASAYNTLQGSPRTSTYNTLQGSPRASAYNTLQGSPRTSTYNTLQGSPRSSSYNTLQSPSRPSAYSTQRGSPRASAYAQHGSPRASAYSTQHGSPRASAYSTLHSPANGNATLQRSNSPRPSAYTIHSPARSSSPHPTVSSSTSASRPQVPTQAPPPPPSRKEMALVLYDISISINPNVLECREGDQIVIEEDFGDWLRATKDGREGFVPYNYVQRMKWGVCWEYKGVLSLRLQR